MKRLTLDSNVYVSAFEFGGLPMRLVEQARSGLVDVAVTVAIVREIQRVLRIKFSWTEKRLDQFERNIARFTTRIDVTSTLDVVPGDADDNRIVECAVAAASEAIITGDKHLLRLKNYNGIAILTVRDFFAGR